ncbi:MAG: zinc ribbon domain-containing protein [Candidatus Eisenbacteria bacterium]|nr:zinc ribbon domain-containing protein [Candidatus Eisenbacteria bacterium]
MRRLAHCQSCAASLREEHNQGPSDRYCRWCSDEAGRLRPRAEVTRILAGWLQHWQEGLSADQALRRAESYMKLMPAWSEN